MSLRTYRVSRLLAGEPLDESFERVPGLVLAIGGATWRGSTNAGTAAKPGRDAPRGVRRTGAAARTRHSTAALHGAGEPDTLGWRVVTVPVESSEQAVRELLRLSPPAELLAPVALRDRMVATLSAMTVRYAAS